MMIKAFTVYQPWASLIMIGAKPYEFRKWSYLERGGVKPGDAVGIHASLRPVKLREVEDLLERLDDAQCTTGLVADKARSLLNRLKACRCRGTSELLERGSLIGTVRIGEPRLSVNVFPGWATIADSDRIEHCRYAWPMNNPRPLDAPIPVRGRQQFFNVSIDERLVAKP